MAHPGTCSVEKDKIRHRRTAANGPTKLRSHPIKHGGFRSAEFFHHTGGPLFSEHGVLVGLHFASLVTKHGLAVPASAIAEFLRKTATGNRVKFIEPGSLLAARAAYEPRKVTVYVEILGGSSGRDGTPLKGGEVASLKRAIEQIFVASCDMAVYEQICYGCCMENPKADAQDEHGSLLDPGRIPSSNGKASRPS